MRLLQTECTETSLLGGSWDLVSKVISTLIGVISIVTLIITLVAKSHDPLSKSIVLSPKPAPELRTPCARPETTWPDA